MQCWVEATVACDGHMLVVQKQINEDRVRLVQFTKAIPLPHLFVSEMGAYRSYPSAAMRLMRSSSLQRTGGQGSIQVEGELRPGVAGPTGAS